LAEYPRIEEGRAFPMGATCLQGGVNFSVFSAHAEKIEVCIFSENGKRELARLALPERSGSIWHGFVPGLRPGTLYGLRAHGPYDPEHGHRFNPNKLLIDPYAKQLSGGLRWSNTLYGYRVGGPRSDLGFDPRDSAFAVPKCVTVNPSYDWDEDIRPEVRLRDTVIYEGHVKGLTAERRGVPKAQRGHFAGVASDAMLEHYQKLGITALELLPVQAFLDDQFLTDRGLVNYWGYQTIGFFAPEPRYLGGAGIAEFQHMVRRLHSAGIEVILDVVYNHSGEGNELGPTLSFRGLDNKSYYRLLPEHQRYYVNDTGCGNSLNFSHPAVLHLVLDSLRYWVEVMHVDGFRFDLATTLGREANGFDPSGGFFDAILQDPVLNRVKLIAEPWDTGPGGYQLGAFPSPFAEWNDKARDDMRRFWRGDGGVTADFSSRLLGSARQFDHSGRKATSTVNFVTAHDGFTLEDLVSYAHKHNEANGEAGNDGHNGNHSDNLGIEGPTSDPAIRERRSRRKRNLLASVFLSQGTPLLLAGDEIGNTQDGNNNAYCQDNAIGWVNWARADEALLAFTRKLIAFRRDHPSVRQTHFLHGRPRKRDGLPDVEWRLPSGREPKGENWGDQNWKTFGLIVRHSAETVIGGENDDQVFMIFNADGPAEVVMPEAPPGRAWVLALDTSAPEAEAATHSGTVRMPPETVRAYTLQLSRGRS
jgi:glycogen operon protein